MPDSAGAAAASGASGGEPRRARRNRDRDRPAPAFDPFDHVADALADRRRDGGAEAPADADREPVPERLPRPPTRNLLLAVAVVIAVVLLRAATGGGAPELATSCTTPAVRLSADRAMESTPVTWAVTGPGADQYVLAIDAASVAAGPGGTPTLVPAGPQERSQLGSEVIRLSHCSASGVFGVRVPPGEHTVTLFRLTAAGSQAVTSAPLVVEPAARR